MVHLANNVTPQRKIEVIGVQIYDDQQKVLTAELSGKFSILKIVDRQLELRRLEGQRRPRLLDHELLRGTFQFE